MLPSSVACSSLLQLFWSSGRPTWYRSRLCLLRWIVHLWGQPAFLWSLSLFDSFDGADKAAFPILAYAGWAPFPIWALNSCAPWRPRFSEFRHADFTRFIHPLFCLSSFTLVFSIIYRVGLCEALKATHTSETLRIFCSDCNVQTPRESVIHRGPMSVIRIYTRLTPV